MSPTIAAATGAEAGRAGLEALARELTASDYQATVCTPPGRLPYLHVLNPRASVLTERVYTRSDAFWFSWGERIAGCDQVGKAAALVARVLRTVDAE